MTKYNKYKNKSISELEGWQWNTEVPNHESSFVERKFYDLHKVKLKDYTAEDIRFMIGQNTGIEYLIPMAIEIFHTDIFIETDFYKGSLLEKVLEIPQDYWTQFPKQKKELLELIEKNKIAFKKLEISDDIKQYMIPLILQFMELKADPDIP
jgi:hypothetical protein